MIFVNLKGFFHSVSIFYIVAGQKITMILMYKHKEIGCNHHENLKRDFCYFPTQMLVDLTEMLADLTKILAV